MNETLTTDPVDRCPHCRHPLPVGHLAWMTLEQAAAYSNVTARTLRRKISEGLLPASRLDTPGSKTHGQLRVKVGDLDNLLHPIPTATAAGRRAVEAAGGRR